MSIIRTFCAHARLDVYHAGLRIPGTEQKILRLSDFGGCMYVRRWKEVCVEEEKRCR